MKKKWGRRAHAWIALLLLSALAFCYFYRGIFTRPVAPPVPPAPPIVVQEPPAPPAFALTPMETFRFEDAASLSRWERKVFKGNTDYQVRGSAPNTYLHALSENSSCGLFMKVHHEALPGLYLRWSWRVDMFPKKKDPTRLSNRGEDDFAARVYVIFEASNLFHSDVIEYVWDENLAVGEAADSPYSDRIKLLVVRSGAAPADGSRQTETRNLLADYQHLFGKPPKHPVGIVALMCDSDNTGTSAEAEFGEIVFGSGKE